MSVLQPIYLVRELFFYAHSRPILLSIMKYVDIRPRLGECI